MNPEQLGRHDDPARADVLQVRAEDHTEADLMFPTLMGDQVEPRANSSQTTRRDVKNLTCSPCPGFANLHSLVSSDDRPSPAHQSPVNIEADMSVRTLIRQAYH